MAVTRKKQEAPSGGGCPEYMLTYGDMMSLLLCFFVIIVSLSKIKEEEKFQAVLDSMKKAFGYSTSKSPVPGTYVDSNSPSLIQRIQNEIKAEARRRGEENSSKASKTQSQIGKSTTVRNIRDGLMITVGGLALFAEGRADILPEGEEELKNVAKIIKGYRNKILIRGHTSRLPLPAESPFKTHMDLAYARAANVAKYLEAEGVSADRLNVEACAGNEPVKTFVTGYDEDSLANNRRAEIVVKDQMVEDFEGEKSGSPKLQESAHGG